jgi:hypothetical protein
MPVDYDHMTDSELLSWSANFGTKLALAPTSYGSTVAIATEFNTLQETYANALMESEDPNLKGPRATLLKNEARKALLDYTRPAVRTIQAFVDLTNAQRLALDITIPDDQPSPHPVPEEAPELLVTSVPGRKVRVRLKDVTGKNPRGKPDLVSGASVFSFVGATPPETVEQWKFEANVTRTKLLVQFPASVPAGAQVWLTACWYNSRAQSGPPCPAVTTNLIGGVAQAA